MLLKPAPVSTRQFTYNDATRTFSADMSDTHGLGRVYDDACDDGLTLVSSRTGAEIVFVVQQVDRDAENDVIAWQLRSTCRRYFMQLWND